MSFLRSFPNPGLATRTSGLKFLGSAVAADVNTMAEYERGRWTPTLISATAGSFTLASTDGSYVRIDDRVWVHGYMSVGSRNSATGAVTIGGLPFTVGSGSRNFGPGPLCVFSISSSLASAIVEGDIGQSRLQIRVGNGSAFTTLDSSLLGSGAELAFSFHYEL